MNRSRKRQQQPTPAEKAVKRMLLTERREWFKEREVLQRYPFKEAWLRKTRRLIREGFSDAGPAFASSGRLIFYRRQAIEDWLRAHELGATNGAASAK